MRGKKVDTEFVSSFITKCVQLGHDTPDAIVKTANQRILEIDEAIKAMELQKAERSKLLDVVSTFDKSSVSKVSEAKILSFFKLQYPDVCRKVCRTIKVGPVLINQLSNDTDVVFCIKQLLEHKIIAKSGNYLLRGDQFDNYWQFALKENV